MRKNPNPPRRRPQSSSAQPSVAALAGEADSGRKVGVSSVKRLPSYLQLLRVLQTQGKDYVSGTVLASVHHLEPVIVRKDLATTGIIGTPRLGFRVTELITAIERFLGWDNQTKAVLVGVGHLGTALLGYRGFENFGLRIVASFDTDPQKIGKWVHGCRVQSLSYLTGFVRRGEILLGVLTVPSEAAQDVADLMVAAGIKGIWNFTPAKLSLPESVTTQKEDLAEGLAVLSHRLHHPFRPPRTGVAR